MSETVPVISDNEFPKKSDVQDDLSSKFPKGACVSNIAETFDSSLLDRFADLTVQGRCVCLESSRGRKFLSIECTNGQEIVV